MKWLIQNVNQLSLVESITDDEVRRILESKLHQEEEMILKERHKDIQEKYLNLTKTINLA